MPETSSPTDEVTLIQQPEGHRTVDPLPSEDELSAFYRDVYFQTVPTAAYSFSYDEEELAQRRLRAEMLVRTAMNHLAVSSPDARKPGLFDIGFGEGFELAAARAAGLQVGGVDYTLEAIRRFHPDLEDSVEAGDPLTALTRMAASADMHDIVVLRNVLEHVREPAELLRAAAAVTTSGGVIAVTVPNDFTSLQADLMERGLVERPYWVAAPQHLQYFRADRFGNFANSCGLQVADIIGDFPIEIFLYHSGSNYVQEPTQGRAAHRARIMIDLLCARYGLERFTAFCRASAAVGLGRAFTAFMTHPR